MRLKSQLTSSISTINHCRRFKEGLETQLASTSSISLIIGSNISDVTSSSIKLFRIGYSLWHRYCHCLRIKNLILATHSLCKYTWEVNAYIVLTGKGRLGPNIWPKTPKQAGSIENMIRLIWGKEAHWQYKTSGTKSCVLSPPGKKVRFVGPPYCYGHLVTN